MEHPHVYYQKKSRKFSRKFIRHLQLAREEIQALTGAGEWENFKHKGLEQLELLLKELPYIGGDKNNMTSYLVQSAYFFAVYDVLSGYQIPLNKIGHLLTIMGERQFDKIPNFIGNFAGKHMCRSSTIKKKQLKRNHPGRAKYPEDFVFTIEEVRNADCDIKVNYTQCAIHLFAKRTGHLDILPYMCNLDYKLYKKLGLNLRRTKILAQGYECCNFMISLEGDALPVWPPNFLDNSTDYR